MNTTRETYIVRQIGFNIVPYVAPTGKRRHHLRMYSSEGRCAVEKRIVDPKVTEEALEGAIRIGELFKAFIFLWVLGKKNDALVKKYPWWGPFLEHHTKAKCVCGKVLGEDRAINVHCIHQLCTHCALTLHRNSLDKCPVCDEKIRYLLFNGRQCDDQRSHPDLI